MNARNRFLIAILFTSPFVAGNAYSHDCVVKEWSLSRDIREMRPVGVSQKFSSKEATQIFVFAALNCLSFSDAIIVRFERDGKVLSEKPIAITPANNYRIWTSVSAVPGRYKVFMEIQGELLNSDEFVIDP